MKSATNRALVFATTVAVAIVLVFKMVAVSRGVKSSVDISNTLNFSLNLATILALTFTFKEQQQIKTWQFASILLLEAAVLFVGFYFFV